MAVTTQPQVSEIRVYLEAVVNLVLCAVVGGTALLVYLGGMVQFLLAPKLQPLVLVGGLVLLVLALSQLAVLLILLGERGRPQPPTCRVAGPQSALAFRAACRCLRFGGPSLVGDTPAQLTDLPLWRYVIIVTPVLFFLTGLPNSGYSSRIGADQRQVDTTCQDAAVVGDGVMFVDFFELSNAANSSEMRQTFEGRVVRIKGLYQPVKDRECTLYRVRIVCCAADAVPMRVRIICRQSLPSLAPQTPVEITGQVQFRPIAGQDAFLPVIQLQDGSGVQVLADASPNEFLL